MKFNFQQAFRALILLLFTTFIFKLHFTGEITQYVNPKYLMLSQIAAGLFLFFFLIQLQRVWTEKHEHTDSCNHEEVCCQHDHGNTAFSFKKLISYAIIIFPLVTGFLLPAKTLDASVANKKGVMTSLTNQAQQEKKQDVVEENEDEAPEDKQPTTNEENDSSGIEDGYDQTSDVIDPNVLKNTMSKEEHKNLISKLNNTQHIKMDDFRYNSFYEEISKDLEEHKGKTISLNGFVYKEEGFNSNQLVIARFLVTHCVADASIVGFLTEFPEVSTLNEDTWISAEGVLEITEYNGVELPLIKVTDWKKIDEPKDPYLYPITIKLM